MPSGLEQRKDGMRQDSPQGIWRLTAPGDVPVVFGLPLKLWRKPPTGWWPERTPAGTTMVSRKDGENEIGAGMGGDDLGLPDGPLIGDIIRFWNGCPGLLGGRFWNAMGGRLSLRTTLRVGRPITGGVCVCVFVRASVSPDPGGRRQVRTWTANKA